MSVAAANCAEANAAATAAIVAGDQARAWLAAAGSARPGWWPTTVSVRCSAAGRRVTAAARTHRRAAGRTAVRGRAAGHAMSAARRAPGSQGLWFVSRASGLVLLVLFSTLVVLGVATRLGSAPRRWPRFVVAELHRTLSLFAVAFLRAARLTAILDPFVTIGWAATVLPFASPYRTLAIGLGTLAVDLGGAVLLTSLVRRRLG